MKFLVFFNLVAFGSAFMMSPNARVDFVPGNSQISGYLDFYDTYFGVRVVGCIKGLTPGTHGFHVHEKGDLSDQCKAAGGHFNPFMANHGAQFDKNRHVGDLGNIQATYKGEAYVNIWDPIISLNPLSPSFIGNLAVVVHEGRDDLGRGGNEESLKTGNAGARAGCGIIKLHY